MVVASFGFPIYVIVTSTDSIDSAFIYYITNGVFVTYLVTMVSDYFIYAVHNINSSNSFLDHRNIQFNTLFG